MAASGRLAIAATATVVIALIATYSLTHKQELEGFARCRATNVVGGSGAIGGPFTLTDENGSRVTDKEVLSKPALVYFGYTYCPDVCPTDSARNAEAVDILEENGHEVTPVFISVDPGRDTPEVLKEWTDYLHPRMIGLTGSEEEIKAVTKEYKTYYKVPEAPADDSYMVDHMTQTYLMLPGHGFVEFFGRDETSDQVAERTACFLDAAQTEN
ncbi:SCO family protein [Frigidibacter sp. RF13]|uniref:SCO family protein n=1 Tax=Frigidibacter sp. RF13 TaxID=2997340 RepID=UPI00226D7E27|nr:SCO family protein [Frigidibacter sp. RF13]MCY1126458.1 SCO family protein [Frigidibacter sp. RF13]